MSRVITYGLGGYCAECSPEHDHPLNNLISDVEVDDESVSE